MFQIALTEAATPKAKANRNAAHSRLCFHVSRSACRTVALSSLNESGWSRISVSCSISQRSSTGRHYHDESLAIPRQRYVVRAAIRLSGQNFLPGERISAFTIPADCWGMLAKLIASEKIAQVAAENGVSYSDAAIGRGWPLESQPLF